MFEAHIMVKKNEVPVITLVVLNSRIMLIYDWLIKLNEFLLSNTTVVQPS